MTENNTRHAKDQDNLQRFIEAQTDIYDTALAEIVHGEKRSHWMWFIFPQILGLGSSSKSIYYSIKNADEAKQYLNHPLLGMRLLECTTQLLTVTGKTAQEIFGHPDDMKLKSSMTLFDYVSEPNSKFAEVLRKYFGGRFDDRTLQILRMYER